MRESEGRVYIVCTKTSGLPIAFDLRKVACLSSVAHPDSPESGENATEIVLELGQWSTTYVVLESVTDILDAVSEALQNDTGSEHFQSISWGSH